MDLSLKQKLIDVYRRYGFQLARDQSKDSILVFTLKNGYFDNAEIVKLNLTADAQNTFEEFTQIGFACKTRLATSPEQAENELFKGFFSVDSTRERLQEDYRRFSTNIVAAYDKDAQYNYIKAPYQINGKDGYLSPPEEVLRLINEEGPILFLIEAAAGFGKTCTALEIVKLLADDKGHLPLYAELSRNRQARIFRYILLDEIDRTFPLLSSKLVQTEIQNGRIATILDGFDELLRKNEDTGSFENKEPMLETVSEMLSGNAKIIITTRRTVLFDGDEFHQWLDRHADSFKIIRIRIQEPQVSDWLNESRLNHLEQTGLRIEAMANPVLLSYLRCINDAKFSAAVSNPENIVESYFTYMLDRERERQDLRMSVTTQNWILRSIAEDMIQFGYTAEARDYIINYILSNLHKILDETREQYPATDKPSREEIANKLASHALLDRSDQDPNKISFINEFAFGHYVAENIINNSEWLNDDLRFIDPAVRSYQPRSVISRKMLYSRLSASLDFLDNSSQIEITTELMSRMPVALADGEAEGITLNAIRVGEFEIKNFQFNDCIFKRCEFDLRNLKTITFLNCRFYDCTVPHPDALGSIFVLGGTSDPDIVSLLGCNNTQINTATSDNTDQKVDSFLLKKLWPIGESFEHVPSRPIFRPIKVLCYPTSSFSSGELYNSINRMKKQRILTEMNKTGLITINQDELAEVQKILLAHS